MATNGDAARRVEGEARRVAGCCAPVTTDASGSCAEIKVITLWQPWATWIMFGWKKIETRTHSGFKTLIGKRIGIHAGLQFDTSDLVSDNHWLTPRQIEDTMPLRVPRGALLGMALVEKAYWLNHDHSKDALIDCSGYPMRYGLFLKDIVVFEEPIPMRGRQGIWTAQLPIRTR